MVQNKHRIISMFEVVY